MARTKQTARKNPNSRSRPKPISRGAVERAPSPRTHAGKTVSRELFARYRKFRDEGTENPLMLGVRDPEAFTPQVMTCIMQNYSILCELYPEAEAESEADAESAGEPAPAPT